MCAVCVSYACRSAAFCLGDEEFCGCVNCGDKCPGFLSTMSVQIVIVYSYTDSRVTPTYKECVELVHHENHKVHVHRQVAKLLQLDRTYFRGDIGRVIKDRYRKLECDFSGKYSLPPY